MAEFWGRHEELKSLRAWDGRTSQLTVVYGRRRVGKTRLVEEAYRNTPIFHVEGLEKQSQANQQSVFLESFATYRKRAELTGFSNSNWRNLLSLVSNEIGQEPTIVFLDEFQWLAGGRTTLVSDIKYAWDNLFTKRNRVHLILCGSVSSFMVGKVLRSNALYGRIDREVHLLPLRLPEIRTHFGTARSIKEIVELYMALGGVPQYLKLVDKTKSTQLNLKELFFARSGYLVNEFDRLFASHFGTNRHYRDILLALAEHHWADREQLSRWCKLDSGGRISEYLQNLQTAGFIEEYAPVDRHHAQRGLRYRLIDLYLLFYFRFVHRNRKRIQNQVGPPNMSTFMPDRAYAAWRGIAFEFVCYLHHFELATALGFSAVNYQVGPWFEKGEKGRKAQIDLLFIRADNVITLCEIKFVDDPVGVQVIKDVQHKIATLANPKRKTVERVLVTASPPTTALRNEGYFHRIIELESMF